VPPAVHVRKFMHALQSDEQALYERNSTRVRGGDTAHKGFNSWLPLLLQLLSFGPPQFPAQINPALRCCPQRVRQQPIHLSSCASQAKR